MMCTSHQPTEGADSAPMPNHYAIDVDGAMMAFGPGDEGHAERMRAAYQRINPRANVAIRYSRCDENPYGPCNAHKVQL